MTLEFPSPTGYPVFYRTYSRFLQDLLRESWGQTIARSVVEGLSKFARFTPEESALVERMSRSIVALPSGRWLWVGGTKWIENPANWPGAFNCHNSHMRPSNLEQSGSPWEVFGYLMELAMMGCGVGRVCSLAGAAEFPPITRSISVQLVGEFGDVPKGQRTEETIYRLWEGENRIVVGDSREGWAEAFQSLLEIASDHHPIAHGTSGEIALTIDLSHVRPAGERLSGFGGVANPIKLPELFGRVATILNHAVGRKLTPLELALVSDEAALVIVAGNLRRSAGMVQLDANDDRPIDWLGVSAATAKQGLWVQDPETRQWRIDPNRDALRMSNHTRVFMHKPTEFECIESVRSQYYSGEGAIQYAPEEIARANRDLLATPEHHREFLKAIEQGRDKASGYLRSLMDPTLDPDDALMAAELDHRLGRYGLNPCGEATGDDFFCNLSTVCLNQRDPLDFEGQEDAFRAAGLFAAALLQRGFDRPRYQFSREIDPIVLVSFTGGFDFFVQALGVDWLRWWEAGRPDWWLSDGIDPRIQEIAHKLGLDPEAHQITDRDGDDEPTGEYQAADLYRMIEAAYLNRWRTIVERTIWDYCDRHGLRRPNRCTGLKPEGTLSLLTGASSGWHPPKAARFIRRITFAKGDPVALACLDYGYSVVPSQSDKDENGNLLNDPLDPRCTEWLVEIPIAVSWADLPGADTIAIEKLGALAQFDFWMQVQRHYSTHSTSATIELREHEIEPLGRRIYQAIQDDEGYISTALLARFDDRQTYPRLPFEPISREEYDRLVAEMLVRRQPGSFEEHLARRDREAGQAIDAAEQGPAGCDSDKCLLPERK